VDLLPFVSNHATKGIMPVLMGAEAEKGKRIRIKSSPNRTIQVWHGLCGYYSPKQAHTYGFRGPRPYGDPPPRVIAF